MYMRMNERTNEKKIIIINFTNHLWAGYKTTHTAQLMYYYQPFVATTRGDMHLHVDRK